MYIHTYINFYLHGKYNIKVYIFKHLYLYGNYDIKIYIYIYTCTYIYITREISVFGEISLALRGSGAFGVHVGAPSVPIGKTAAHGGGERKVEEIIKKIGAPWAPPI